jgi:hypothetical protein
MERAMQTQSDQFSTLRLTLEEQFQQHTEELTGLTAHRSWSGWCETPRVSGVLTC